MQTLEVNFKRESDRATLLGCLIAAGYTAQVNLVQSTNIKDILNDTPYEVWPILLIKDAKKISFRRCTSVGPNLVKNWPEDAASIIEYFSQVPIMIPLTRDYNATVNKRDQVVEVGCQNIPFAKIDELYNLIHQDA